ncbi:MAG TPA: carboxypeptidase-like regulatory domain-containing protein, partial [Planctomycetota bacterium]|nr:carboxypeptidase-like regulatory domain-containing protein [Planctomycetota bacterium]
DWGDYEMRGRVVDVRGVPIAGANVYLSWFHREGEIRSSATRTATADDRGEFEFTRLGPGIHRVNVNAPGYRAAQANHDVVSGGRVIEIRLDPSS